MVKRIPGTKDILPQEAFLWQCIEELSRHIFSVFNYKEIRPPLIEEAALFNRSLGESAEIVKKQMFLIPPPTLAQGSQKEKALYALRPEATASIVRAYIENNLDKTSKFIKLYYIGPMFRRERPQRGRLRQFSHIGCEAIGSSDACLDIEVISLADSLLKAYKIDNYTIQMNSLGCEKDRKSLVKILKENLKKEVGKLCVDCKNRFKGNTLRVLDCKNEDCRKVISKLNIRDSHLCADCKAHFQEVKEGLSALKIDYRVSPYLVRGLDYYTRTVFEITHNALGAQDALGAGGRYDNLVAQLGGPQTGAIGFALGVERLLLVTKPESHEVASRNNLVYLISLGQEAGQIRIKLLADLRKNSICADTDYEAKSIKGAMRKANDLGARYTIIIGEDELKKNVVTLKDMSSGEQKEIAQDRVLEHLQTQRVVKPNF